MNEPDLSHLDFSEISFPSDSLTVAKLRQVNRDGFDIGYDSGGEAQPRFFLDESYSRQIGTIGDMLYIERTLAAVAYCSAAGILPPDVPIDDFKDDLANLYVKYDIATGRHHCDQLFRDIESQGAAMLQTPAR